jgi:TatD DNase family protein
VCNAGRLFCTVGVHPTRCGVVGIFGFVFAIVV